MYIKKQSYIKIRKFYKSIIVCLVEKKILIF